MASLVVARSSQGRTAVVVVVQGAGESLIVVYIVHLPGSREDPTSIGGDSLSQSVFSTQRLRAKPGTRRKTNLYEKIHILCRSVVLVPITYLVRNMPVSGDPANSKAKESSSARSSDEEYYEPDEEELEEERKYSS